MGKKVLLIEDEPNIIEAISFILSRDGWEVKTHANGHDAMDAVRRRAPDLIILDVMLPGKSGYDILGEIRHDADYASTPVLMLTKAKLMLRDEEDKDMDTPSSEDSSPKASLKVPATMRSYTSSSESSIGPSLFRIVNVAMCLRESNMSLSSAPQHEYTRNDGEQPPPQ